MKIPVNKSYYLSPIGSGDAQNLVRHLNDIEIYTNTLTIPFPYRDTDASKFLAHVSSFNEKNGSVKDYAIRVKSGALIGGIGLLYNHGMDSHKTEIGYWLAKDHRKRGIMSMVIKAFVDHIFSTTSLIRLEAQVFKGNFASAKVLEKNGFQYEGAIRKAYKKDGKYKDTLLYAIVRENCDE